MKNLIILFLLAGTLHSCSLLEECFFLNNSTLNATGGGSTVTDGESWETKPGAQLSIESNIYDLNENSSFKTGFGFSFIGAKWEDTYMYSYSYKSANMTSASSMTGKTNLFYFIVPLMYSYENRNGLYAEIGLQPSLLLSAKEKYNGTSHDYKNSVNSFDLGLPAGIGYRLKNGIGFGVKAIYGLTNMDKTEGGSGHNLLFGANVNYQIIGDKKK